jgi:ferritin
MLKSSVEEALNSQLNFEMTSAYLYMAMAAYFESQNLAGMSNWMTIQLQEELQHSNKFYHFINERDGRVDLRDIKILKKDWNSPLEAFEESLEHEQKVTARINNLVDLSLKESDHATNNFLQWFVSEQVEEEASVKQIVDKLKFIKDNPVALFMIDQELASRVLGPAPAAV